MPFHHGLRASARTLILVVLALVLMEALALSSDHLIFAQAAPANRDEAGRGPRHPSLHHTGLRDGDFFDSLDALNAPLLDRMDPISRLRETLFEPHNGAVPEADYVYTGRNDTLSTITTLSMSSVTTMDGSSSCSASLGCPRSSVAWASGTFTFTELITPASLSTDANLSLKMSLCCDYKFHGALLRDTVRYDQFLSFLLQASPFQVLSPAAKAQLFPQQRAFIVNTKTGQAYDHTYTLTESDVQTGNDGDGDVIVLFTGKVDAAELAKVAFSSLRSPTEGTDSRTAASSSSSTGQRDKTETTAGAREDASADMQLKIVNTVLKCKCPHTLLVMPLLHMQRDTLPPISILGLGPHCGLTPVQTQMNPHRYITRVLREGATRADVTALVQSVNASSMGSSARALDGLVGYATSFLISPPVLPASTVHWRIREEGRDGRVVLDHTRVLVAEVDSTGALLLDHAASPYWLVEPDVRYRVEVTVTRHGVQQSSEGVFVLRLPFYRSWALPPVRPKPHFGFTRQLTLSDEETLAHEEVPRALDASLPPTLPKTGRRALSYHGYWENTPLHDQLLPQKTVHVHHNPYDAAEAPFPLFVGKNILAYFVRDIDDVCDPVPLEGRELWAVQGIITTPSPITACAESQEIAALILRQLLWRMRRDRRFLVNLPTSSWANRAEPEEGKEGDFGCQLWQSSTSTAEARSLCQAMRTMDGGLSGTTASLRLPYRDVYRVTWMVDLVVDNVSSATAMLVPENIDHEFVTVHMQPARNTTTPTPTTTEDQPGSHLVRLEVRSRPHLVVRRVASYPSAMTIELPMHERRWRVAPPHPLPSSLSPSPLSGKGDGRDARHQPYRPREAFGSEDEAPSGYWLTRSPLALRSVNERLEAMLDTRDVPNVQRRLPNGTLVFVAQDAGEDLAAVYGVSYLARCPDVLVDVLVSVVAIKAPPIVPAYVPLYTEESCVEVRPPRGLRKDEVLEWRVPACPQASHPPFLVQREVSYDDAALEAAAERKRVRAALAAESARKANRRRRYTDDDDDDVEDNGDRDARHKRAASSMDADENDDFDRTFDEDELPGVPVPGTHGRRRVVMLACGVEVYTQCEVTWTATNLVGIVTKTYSLHRCQSPPDIVFHVDGLQQDRGLPSRYFALPSIVERVPDVVSILPATRPANATTAASATLLRDRDTQYDDADGEDLVYTYTTYSAATGTWETHRRLLRDDEYVPYTMPTGEADGLRQVLHTPRRFLSRTVIPLAGDSADVGYSFNFTGPQSYFEAEMTPLIGSAANQLLQTRAHFTYPYTLANGDRLNLDAEMETAQRHRLLTRAEIPALLWRRLTRLELALAAEQRQSMTGSHSHKDTNWGARYADENDDDWLTDDDMGSDDAEDWQRAAHTHSTDDDASFWADLHSGRQQRAADGTTDSDTDGQTARSPVEVYWRKLQREAQRRTRAEDARLNREFLLRHHVDRRRLELHRLHNASLYPMDYVVRASGIAPNAAAEADRPEFAKRGMCLEHPGHTSVLVINPRGAVLEDERYGTLLPPPPAPAVAVLPFCQEQYVFSRHPHLDLIYHYDFTWECEDTAILQADKRDPVFSTITHVEVPALNGSRALHRNATNCRLVVQNHLTQTARADWFLVQRVFPTRLTSADFVLLGDGAAHTVLVRASPSLASPTTAGRGGPRYRGGSSSSLGNSVEAEDARRSARASVPSTDLYVRRPNGYDGHARRVVGPSAVVHVDAPSNPNTARWSLRAFIPQHGDPAGTEAAMARVHFTSLFQHPAAVARGRGGSTALVKGLHEPGLYTIGHYLPDPGYPLVCPNVSLVETLDVFRARVLERELFICGGTATLRAVPIPHDLVHEFIGQWEVVALETAPEEVWTRGVNFTGIRFDHGSRDTTLVHGLPFGVLTIRWAVYRVYTDDDDDDAETTNFAGPGHHRDDGTDKIFSRSGGSAYADLNGPASSRRRHSAGPRRVLVDYDSVRVIVLTENLFSHRLVTLSSAADVVTTSSTTDWVIRDGAEQAHPGPSHKRRALKGGSARQDPLDPRLGWQPLLNLSSYYPVHEPIMFPYVGAHPPRPGAGLLTMDQVPVGTTELMYTLRPSVNLFGPMVGHTCELRGTFLIERVSAYFTVNTTLDHECDGYTGTAKVSMCLHAELPPAMAHAQKQRGRRASAYASAAAASSAASSEAWAANVQLVPLDTFERVVKDGAQQVESSGCTVPWWVWPSTRWSDLTPIRREGLPSGRCVRFTVQADRHLSPREVALPLFLATPGSGQPSYGRGVALVDANGVVIAGSEERSDARREASARQPHTNSSTSRGHRVCASTPDFITGRVIDGAEHVSFDSSTSSSTGQPADRGLAGSFIFARSQKQHRGMLAYLPILDPRTLYRRDAAMRPLVGLQGLPDETTTELNVTRGNESIVTLRLDLAEPRLLGGYVAFHDPTAAPMMKTRTPDDMDDEANAADEAEAETAPLHDTHANHTDPSSSSSLPARTRRQSLMLQCVHGHVRASDALQFWTETNRPDGVVDRTAEEWLAYVHAVQDMPVPCELLFPSLDHILSTTEVIDRTGKSRVVASSTTNAAMASRPTAGMAIGGSGAFASATAASSRTAHPSHAQLVPLEIVELQLERIQRAFRVTQDGIDVTGLRPELQHALARRRLSPQQLRELEQARQTLQKEETERTVKRRLALMTGTRPLSRAERVLKVMEAYRGVTGMEPSAIRLRLPRYEAFSTPYDLLLRTALHKDVICGTHIDYPPSVPSLQPTPVTNRHSLVTMSRVEIIDVAPLMTPPGPIKQCEVEGDVPVLVVNISGAVFSEPYFTADRVELQELPNPNAPPTHSPEVGLVPCLGALRSGMHAVVGHTTHKTLFLQLSACPQFQMLSSEDYNEYQDSEELLRRLQHPRFLQVRIREALRADSFTARGREARDVTFVVEVRPTLARLHLHAAELAGLQPPRASRASTAAAAIQSVLPFGRGSSGAGGAGGQTYTQRRSGATFDATTQRPLLMCESDLRQHGFELGIELIGDTWTAPVGVDGEYAIQHDAAEAEAEAAARRRGAGVHQPWQPPRYTISARGTLDEPTRRRAPQNTALINSFSIVEHYSLDSTHHLYLKGGGVYRSHFVNYLFSTILADRDILLHHEFVRRYNETFVGVEVPPQPENTAAGLDRRQVWGASDGVFDGLGDSEGHAAYSRGRGRYDGTRDDLRAKRAWQELPAVRRFSKVEEILFAVPGIATNCHGCLLADTTFFVAGDLTGLWAFLDERSTGNGHSGSNGLGLGTRQTPPLSPHHLTAKQLPGFGTPALEPAFLSRPLIIPWDAAEHIPRQWHLMWLCPASAYRALEQFQQYWRAPVVPSAAAEGGAYVEASVVVYALRDAVGAELAPAHRPTTLLTSEPVPLAQLLLQSQARQPMATDSRTTTTTQTGTLASNARFTMSASSLSAAYTAIAADLLRYRRPHVLAAHTFDFHRDGLYTNGVLAVNASVFVKLCVPLPASARTRDTDTSARDRRPLRADGMEEVRAEPVKSASDAQTPVESGPLRQCMIVSITDTLLTVEPAASVRPHTRSWLRRLLGLGSSARTRASPSPSPRYASPLTGTGGLGNGAHTGHGAWTWATVLHNALLSLVVYALLPNLGLVEDSAAAARLSAQHRRQEDFDRRPPPPSGASPARVGLSVMALVFLMFAHTMAPTSLWVACWLAIWSAALYVFKSVEAVIGFIVSAVYWRLTLELS